MQYQQLNLNEFNAVNRTSGSEMHLRGDGSIDMDYYMARAQNVRAAETAKGARVSEAIRPATMKPICPL